ncbi:MAG: hypothetical protein ACREQL_09400 [Candidatus Binatia bacterium]
MRFSGPAQAFSKYIASHGTTRISTSHGVSVDDGAANDYGSYAQIISGANLTHDCYGFWINLNDATTGGACTPGMVTIGVDPAGGTSYTTLVPDFILGPAAPLYGSPGTPGIWSYWPMFIKAGSSVGIKWQTQDTTANTLNAFGLFHCAPLHPESVWAGGSCTVFGVTAASTIGTVITPGSGVEGGWTEIGTLAASYNYWNIGVSFDDTTNTIQEYYFDLSIGDASNKLVVIQNLRVHGFTDETMSTPMHPPWQHYGRGVSGDKVYIRCFSGVGAPDITYVAAYGVR